VRHKPHVSQRTGCAQGIATAACTPVSPDCRGGAMQDVGRGVRLVHIHTNVLLLQVLFEMKYNGQDADVWSCGVSLYVMLTGVFPFSRPTDEVRTACERFWGLQMGVGCSRQIRTLSLHVANSNAYRR
jgi:hypothetical protein